MIKFISLLPPALLLLWSGVSLGGALIAAPAKFQAPSLTLPVALEVGRAQFQWIGRGELIICMLTVLAAFYCRPPYWRWVAVPVALFVVQYFVIMPPLDTRTQAVIAGAQQNGTILHLSYVVLEVTKFCALAGVGYFGLTKLSM